MEKSEETMLIYSFTVIWFLMSNENVLIGFPMVWFSLLIDGGQVISLPKERD